MSGSGRSCTTPRVDDLDDHAEALIVAADRAQHFAQVVHPALDAGRDVVSDRSAFSSLAYQGYGRGVDLDELRSINDWATGGRWPDLVVFLDVDVDVMTARIAKRELDRFERAGHDFHTRVVDGFRAMAAADPDRWIVVRPDGPKDDVADAGPRRGPRPAGAVGVTGSIWDGVIGQPAALRTLQARGRRAGPRLSPGRSARVDQGRGRASVCRRPGRPPAPTTPTPATPGWRSPASTPTCARCSGSAPSISAEQAREIVRLASLAPVEGERKVMILHEFHLLRPEGAALLLKTLEEPPPSTVFIVLVDFVPPELITISSRCARVVFRPIPDDVIAERLVAEGFSTERSAAAVAAAGGDLDRARLLAADDALAARRHAFADVPHRLDGSGRAVMEIVDELLAMVDDAAAPLVARHDVELAELEERAARHGERGSGRKATEERHARELRRHRTDELRSGLGVLTGTYRDALVADPTHRPDELAAAVHRVITALAGFEYNPNEKLLAAVAALGPAPHSPKRSDGIG